MDQIQAILDALSDMKDRIADLHTEVSLTGGEVKHIGSRLDKLNGAVARHEEALGSRALEVAKAEGEAKGKAEARKALDKWVTPAVWSIVGVAVILVLQHAPEILKAASLR